MSDISDKNLRRDILTLSGMNASSEVDGNGGKNVVRSASEHEHTAPRDSLNDGHQGEKGNVEVVETQDKSPQASSELVRNFTAVERRNDQEEVPWQISLEHHVQKIDAPTTYFIRDHHEVYFAVTSMFAAC
eukprot:749499-Hanusia_phi.AAC.1